MSVTEILARQHTFELNTGTVGSPVWQAISNVESFSHSASANDADTTTFDDGGFMTHMKASRSHEFTITCKAQEDADNGAKDAGQAACEAWARLIGPASVKQFRITSPAGNTLVFLCTAVVNITGGGNDDVSPWEMTLTVSGDITDSTSASVPGTPGSADATAGNDSITGTWTASTGSPSGYEVWVYEDAGDTVVQEIFTSDTSIYATGLTDATAYYFKVRGFNAAGYGAWSTVSDTVTTT